MIDDDLLAKVNHALRDSFLDAQIDFGPFGTFASDARPTTPRAELWFPQTLRARIEWLSRACNAFADVNGEPIASLSNHHLAMHLDALKVPSHLLAHRRAIDSELRHFRDRGGHD